MAFADPQSITVDAAAITLPRVNTGAALGQFTSADGAYQIQVGPRVLQGGKRTSRSAVIINTKVTADPLVATTNIRVKDSVRVVIDRPLDGYSDAEVLLQLKALIKWLTDGTDANAKKLIAGEN